MATPKTKLPYTQEAVKFAQDLAGKGKAYSAIVQTLIVMDYAPNKGIAEEIMEAAKIDKRASKRGYTDLMHDWLAEADRTEDELRQWIKDNATDNAMRWFKTHDKVRILCNRVRAKAIADAKK